MVQLNHAVGHHERVVVREADDAGAELDVPGALGGGGDEEFGRGDGFPAGAVVLADPGFVIAQVIQPLEGFKVALEAEGGVFAEPVEGGQEDSNFMRGGSGIRALLWLVRGRSCSGGMILRGREGVGSSSGMRNSTDASSRQARGRLVAEARGFAIL